MSWSYVIRRFLYMILLLLLSSVLSFAIINLPPGDYLTSYLMHLDATGSDMAEQLAAALRHQYGLDQPLHMQFWKWFTGIFQGNMGFSFEWNLPVSDLVAERLPMTLVVSLSTTLFSYAVAIPIGIYSATHQYSLGDTLATLLSFLGKSVPGFLLALILIFLFYRWFDIPIGGLFSGEYQDAPWTWAKFADLLRHLWVPLIVVGLSGTATTVRVMRGNLLDELKKPYVTTARAKGLTERRLILKYPVRVAMNPVISGFAWVFPSMISGQTIVAVVLNLPTIGPLLLQSLLSQDMYLAGSITFIVCALTVIGMFASDILLAVADPRIRLG